MEFLLYLTPIGNEIIQNVIRAKYSIAENIEFCKNKNMFGYTNPNKFVVCTKNIKNSGLDIANYINETVYHEAVHVAHSCNQNRPFYISKNLMSIPPNKLEDVKKSTKLSTASGQLEHEAYWMEDKPEKVNYVLQKYCF